MTDRIRIGLEDTELAWAAGFFDGEGNVGCVKHSSHKQNTYYRLHAQIAQKHREVLDRFVIATGLGKVTGPYPHKGRVLPYFRWSVSREIEVRTLSHLLHPYLASVKRIQFESSIKVMDEYKAGAHARHVAAGTKAADTRWASR